MVPSWFTPVVVAVFGLLFGSFSNVVICRVPEGGSPSDPPESRCPKCGTAIQWYDNVPVLSWLLLRGKCRRCGLPISIQYPLVELASSGLWLLAWALWGVSVRGAFGVALFFCLLILFVIDLETLRLPNEVVYPLIGLGVVGVVIGAVTGIPVLPLIDSGGVFSNTIIAAAVGALAPSMFIWVLSILVSRVRKADELGFGDVKLFFALGLFLGPYALAALFVSSLIGSFVGVVVGVKSGEGLQARFPYGPSIALAAVIVAASGRHLWSWYAGLIR